MKTTVSSGKYIFRLYHEDRVAGSNYVKVVGRWRCGDGEGEESREKEGKSQRERE